MSRLPDLLGMVHLLPLPGAPAYGGSMARVIEAAVGDAETLAEAGFPALMVENYGDSPFFGDTVPPETLTAMTAAAIAVRERTGIPFGVNVLRNDALGALGVAVASGASLIRVNVLTGLMHTDQGPLVGKAAEVMRKRAQMAREVEVWADVMVKHAAPPPGVDTRQVAADTVERGGADAVIVTGTGTGREPDLRDLATVRSAIPSGSRLVIGSGATVDNLAALAGAAESMIVGSSLKQDGDPRNRVDPDRAAHFVKIAADHGLT